MDAREPQLAYSDQQALMLDEVSRRSKGAKIAAVVQHFLGTEDLDGLVALDIGCSGGIVSEQLAGRGARVVGLDIDVPGLAVAAGRATADLAFLCADSAAVPLTDGSVDVVVCNHVYEHVVSPEALVEEIDRVLAPGGVAYLGLGNRWWVMEPHYRLPFLSWLPRPLAHRYVRLSGRAEHYHEAFTGRRGLRRLFGRFRVWDYTVAVIAQPRLLASRDAVPEALARVPEPVLQALGPLAPTFIWVATKADRVPGGPPLPVRRLPRLPR